MVPLGFDPEDVPSPAPTYAPAPAPSPSYAPAPVPKPALTLAFLSLLLKIAKTEKAYAF